MNNTYSSDNVIHYSSLDNIVVDNYYSLDNFNSSNNEIDNNYSLHNEMNNYYSLDNLP
jgi:hypothetical protein